MNDATRQNLAIASSLYRPQAKFYKELVSVFNPESFDKLVTRRGVEHLLEESAPESHKNVCGKIVGSISSILATVAKSKKNKYGALQVARVLCNSVCTPHRFQKKEATCTFCELNKSRQVGKFKLSHLMVCEAFSELVLDCVHEFTRLVIDDISRGRKDFLLVRLLNVLSDCSGQTRECILECFAVASLAVNSAVHSESSSLKELKAVVASFKSSSSWCAARPKSLKNKTGKNASKKAGLQSVKSSGKSSLEAVGVQEPSIEEYWH